MFELESALFWRQNSFEDGQGQEFQYQNIKTLKKGNVGCVCQTLFDA